MRRAAWGPLTAATLSAAAVAVLLRSAGRGPLTAVAVDTLGLAAVVASLLAVLGWVYGLDDPAGAARLSPMALEGGLPLLGVGLLVLTLSGPDGIVGNLVLGPSMTSAMIRRLAIPGALGLLFMSVLFDSLYRLEVIDQQIRLGLLTLAGCGGLVALCHSAGWRLERVIYGQSERLTHLRAAAQTDYLTALPNRQAFDEGLARSLVAARESEQPLGVIMLDVVNLKGVNDHLGHDAGDVALRDVAAFLKARVRGGDIVARWGGDEFAVLCPGATAGALRAVIVRLAPGPTSVEGLRGGFAMLEPGDTGESLIGRADRALIDSLRESDPRRGQAPTAALRSGPPVTA